MTFEDFYQDYGIRKLDLGERVKHSHVVMKTWMTLSSMMRPCIGKHYWRLPISLRETPTKRS